MRQIFQQLMPFVEYPRQAMGMKIKKALGKPCMFGWIVPGWTEFGDDNEFAGLYQQRRPRSYDGVAGAWEFGKQKNFVQRFQWPTQPPSAARDAQQAKFKTALQMWQALTDEQKAVYNKIATRRSKRGYDYYMSITLKSL